MSVINASVYPDVKKHGGEGAEKEIPILTCNKVFASGCRQLLKWFCCMLELVHSAIHQISHQYNNVCNIDNMNVCTCFMSPFVFHIICSDHKGQVHVPQSTHLMRMHRGPIFSKCAFTTNLNQLHNEIIIYFIKYRSIQLFGHAH